MTLGVGGFQVDDRELCVVLQRLQGFVAQQFLDVIHVGTTAEQFSSATSPECVRRDADIQLGLLGARLDEPSKRVVRETLAVEINEQRLFTVPFMATLHRRRTAAAEPGAAGAYAAAVIRRAGRP